MVTVNLEALQQKAVTTKLDTEIIPCPEGEWSATVSKTEVRSLETKNGTRLIYTVTWSVTDEQAKSMAKRDPLEVRQDIWLDLVEPTDWNDPQLDTSEGKNIGLGRYRQAIGQNNDGEWRFGMDIGAGPAILRVGHRTDDKGNVYADVNRVAPAM